MKLYWVGYDRQRVKYAELGAGERYSIATYSGHPWVAVNLAGKCVAAFLPTAGLSTATIP
ncbi:hypothetical protein D3C83_300210 [compost metagenome]